ncbi:probable E3 ubiquitin-protein ligase RZFP34 [Drosophila ficusphila]|uniref:probable E3 ubiquitin-protein ligase RZFP34 n=1 Tax=Drosophila ficusphila TaxID=30025 RepID=UPI0007E72DAF|nr:probable E3 ubiquitin-protein ligase RZFP34 [Drosophila ficusphila]
MVYANILIGLGCVIVAVATAIYLQRPSYEEPQSYRQSARNDSSKGPDSNVRRRLNDQRTRISRPGDKCPVCLEEMSQDNMHSLKCGHAMDKECFEDYRFICRNCPLCGQCVNPTLPGDQCSICCEILKKDDMAFMPCLHALHGECLRKLKESGSPSCPLCREKL